MVSEDSRRSGLIVIVFAVVFVAMIFSDDGLPRKQKRPSDAASSSPSSSSLPPRPSAIPLDGSITPETEAVAVPSPSVIVASATTRQISALVTRAPPQAQHPPLVPSRSRQQQPVPVRHDNFATEAGTVLWNYELPVSRPDSVTTVLLNKPWRARNVSAHERGVNFPASIIVEPIDTRIKMPIKGRVKCNHMTERFDKERCFKQLYAKIDALLFAAIVPNLKLLGSLLHLPIPEGYVMRAGHQQQQHNSNSNNRQPQNHNNDAASSSVRRYFYDLGARSWSTLSTAWFMGNYPDSELFHAVAFEMDKTYEHTYPAQRLRNHFRSWKFVNAAVFTHNRGVSWLGLPGQSMSGISSEQRSNNDEDGGGAGSNSQSSVTNSNSTDNATTTTIAPRPTKRSVYDSEMARRGLAVGLPPAPSMQHAPSVDFAEYLIKKHAIQWPATATSSTSNSSVNKPRTFDFIVIKMDIEGAEWPVLERMIETGAIYLVDEIFLECHISRERRPKFIHERCVDLMNLLRSIGVVCHRWV